MKKTTISTSICVMGAAVLLGSSIPINVSADSSSNENVSVGIIDRVYNPNTGEHVYTNSIFEESRLVDLGWSSEGNTFFVPEFEVDKDNSNQGPSVTRLYNPNATVGAHFYTTSSFERDNLVNHGWKYEGVAFNSLRA